MAASSEYWTGRVYTTGQISKLCKVAPRTVSKWFDSGRLRGYRIPGSQDRRVPEQSLRRFLTEHGMPLGEFDHQVYHHVLVVGASPETLEVLSAELTDSSRYRVIVAASAFVAGVLFREHRPELVAVDLAVGSREVSGIACQLPGETSLVVFGAMAAPKARGNTDGTCDDPCPTADLAWEIRARCEA